MPQLKELGRVVAVHASGKLVCYTLMTNGSWRGPDSLVVKLLDMGHNLRDYSPAHGRRGAKQLDAVAALMKGRVIMPAVPDTTPPDVAC